MNVEPIENYTYDCPCGATMIGRFQMYEDGGEVGVRGFVAHPPGGVEMCMLYAEQIRVEEQRALEADLVAYRDEVMRRRDTPDTPGVDG